jgi:hypothetical protein
VGGFKGAVKKHINEIRRRPGAPVWQENYYEHIIRNEDELNKIREYILTNPLRWAHDRENPERQPTESLRLAMHKRPSIHHTSEGTRRRFLKVAAIGKRSGSPFPL